MKKTLIPYIGWLLLLAAVILYGYGMICAILLSWSTDHIKPEDYPAVISGTMSAIQALLLTNFGIALGFAIVRPDTTLARKMGLSRVWQTGKLTENIPDIPNPMELRDQIQIAWLILYIICLIACFITWGHNDWSDKLEDVVPLVPESGKMLLGVILGYITALFSNKP